MQRTDSPKIIACDLDGFLYRLDTLPGDEYYKIHDEAKVTAAIQALPELAPEAALRLSRESFDVYHDAIHAFLIYAKKTGRTSEEIQQVGQTIFTLYHGNLYELLSIRHPTFFDHTERAARAIERLHGTGMFKFGTLSHACMETWGKRILKERMNILDRFEPHLLLGMDRFGFKNKATGPEAMEVFLEIAGVPPNRVILGEDTFANIIPVHRHFGHHGLDCGLVQYGRNSPIRMPLPAAARWVSSTVEGLFETIERDLSPSPAFPRRGRELIVSDKLAIA
jgi:hypothetical protein